MPTVVIRLLLLLIVATLLGTALPNALPGSTTANSRPDRLVVSEVVTGGASASDELIELYNPTGDPMPLEGLELVYVTASGLTVSRRAAWELGAPELPPGGHLLIAHELGIYAPISDVTYGAGMAATGGSVALRIMGASSAIDAVGWGTAASSWLEGGVAPPPPAGSSLERLPGGSLGSTQDSDDNAADFAVNPVPGPENSASPPVPDPSASGDPQPSASPSATPVTTSPPPPMPPATSSVPPSASASPGPSVTPIAMARALPDGTEVTIEGVALTASDGADGGGYVADDSGGVAVLLSGGSFARGDRLRVSGELDDRYAQRTLRADGSGVVVLGTAPDPAPMTVATGSVGEEVEGRLVRVAGTITAAATVLSAGLAFAVDDGSGPVRLLIGSATGIDVAAWKSGHRIDAVGVVGQRDSSGTGTSGYRVQPRDATDILGADPAPDPTTSPGATATPQATAAPTPSADVLTVAAARQLPKGASATVRGVVTLAPGLVDPTTAALQDATGAIVLRVGDEVGPLARGSLVEVRGVRSTLSGMETLRVTTPPRWVGQGGEPAALPLRTGEAGEGQEATLVIVRGGVVAAPRRSSAGTISLEIDDGSGPLRVSIAPKAGIDATPLATGAWIEVRGVLGQETTGSLPLRGYRVWPRDAADLRVTAPATAGTATNGGSTGGGQESDMASGAGFETLDAIGGAASTDLPVGATLVVGPWAELRIGGLLWDGVRLVALHADAAPSVAALLGGGRPPLAVRAVGLRIVDVEDATEIAVVQAPNEPDALAATGLPPAAPLASLHAAGGDARWVTLVGKLGPRTEAPSITVDGATLAIDRRCEEEPMPRRSAVSVTGILVGEPLRLVVPCGGIAATPTLERSPATVPGIAAATETSVARPSGRESRPAVLPSVLLLPTAATLAAGAVAARRQVPDGTPGPESGEMASEAEDGAIPVPTLTLVPLPRERAP